MVNVGKYTSPMDGIGIQSIMFFANQLVSCIFFGGGSLRGDRIRIPLMISAEMKGCSCTHWYLITT